MKILSVDWDYFVNATANERAMVFPDGGTEDVHDSLQDLIWLTRYSAHPEMKDLGVTKEYSTVVNYFMNTRKPLKVSISHKDLYGYVKELGDVKEIVNIDFHHDFYTFGDEVNCGNWGTYLSREGVEIKWVARDDSDLKVGVPVINIVQALANDYDAIFICRSDMWSPPHLDREFDAFVRAFGGEVQLRDRKQCYDNNTVRAYRDIMSRSVR